jgi:hypothetical protein
VLIVLAVNRPCATNGPIDDRVPSDVMPSTTVKNPVVLTLLRVVRPLTPNVPVLLVLLRRVIPATAKMPTLLRFDRTVFPRTVRVSAK